MLFQKVGEARDATVGEVAGQIPGAGGEFHVVVLQHTDCGITRLAGDPVMLTRYFQIQKGELKTKAVTDPEAAVAIDVALLRAIPGLPGGWLVSGLVYDVTTGLVAIAVPPRADWYFVNINASKVGGLALPADGEEREDRLGSDRGNCNNFHFSAFR
jgi:hypothetical protein